MQPTTQTLKKLVPHPRHDHAGWGLLAGLAACHALVGWLAWRLAGTTGWATPLLPSAGIALAAVMVYGPRALIAVGVGSLALFSLVFDVSGSSSHGTALVLALTGSAVLQAAAGGALVRRKSQRPITLDEPGSIVRLFMLGGVLASALGSAVVAAALHWTAAVPDDRLHTTVLLWWAGNTLGAIVAAPMVLVLIATPREAWTLRRNTVALPLLLLTLLLAASIAQIERWQQQRRISRFESDASSVVRTVEQRLSRYLDALDAIHSVYAGSATLDSEAFKRAANPWLGKLPGVRALLWDERVAQADLQTFEAMLRSSGDGAARIIQADSSLTRNDTEALVLRFVEPLDEHLNAIGLNVLSVPAARPALLKALSSNSAAATAGFRLAIGNDPRPSVVVYRAVHGTRPGEGVHGVVAMALRIGLALDGLNDAIPSYLQVCLIDTQAPPGSRLAGPEDCARADMAPALQADTALTFAGRAWRLHVQAPRGMPSESGGLADQDDAAAALIAMVGTAVASMLGALLLLVTGRTRRVEVAVQARTRELEREITVRQASALALRESEQRFRSIIDSVPVGIVYTDLNGRIHQCNPQFARMLGRTEADLLDMTSPQYTHPDDLEEDQAQRDAVASGQLPIARRRKRLIRDNGEVLSVRFTMTLLRDAQGEPWRLVSAVEDITEHLRLEIAEQARETAESASRAKSEFLSRMSHELRTPLNAMLGFGQLLELDRTEPLRERHRLWVVQIQQAGWHLLEMINDVLDLSRIESGTVSLQLEPLSVEKLIAASMNLVEPLARTRGVTMTRSLAEHPQLRVMADSTRVKQILSNLLSNAVKYNRSGGEVTVATRVVEAPDGTQQLELDVIDNGIGMTPQQLVQLFQPFNRLGRERGSTEGTGIGLVIAKLLAERQGGALEASSTQGQGSVFRLRLPLTEEASVMTDAGALDATDSAYHLRHVLYIEDNETNVEVMRGIFLLRPQIELQIATTGLDGLAAIRTAPPDLVLLDMNLPDIGGMALLQHLQADEQTSKIPVVVVSADALPVLIAAALNAGATRYLTKPVAIDEMLGMLDDMLSQMNTRYS